MAQVTTPVWSDNLTVKALATVARNTVSRTSFDWRAKLGGYLFIRIGRGGAAALSAGVTVLVRRTHNNAGRIQPGGATPQLLGGTLAATSTTCAASGNDAGVTSLTVASTSGIVAGDLIFIANGALTATEFSRVAFVTDGTHLLLDAPTQFAHNDVAHTVRNKADIWTVWVEGGATCEVVFDYGAATTGDTITVEVLAQTLDSLSTT